MPAALPGSFKDDYGSVYKITEQEWKHGKSTEYHFLAIQQRRALFYCKKRRRLILLAPACIPVSTSCILKTWSRGGGVLSYGL
jgi:hypothetical protein